MLIKIKTNGYEISSELQATLDKWIEVSKERLENIAYIDLFYCGDRLIMGTIKLTDNHYGDFNITKNRISFCGCTCTHEQMQIFGSLTYNDECYKGTLFE